MDKVIAFYISNHGFGHAARNIQLIKDLLIRNIDLKIILKSGKKQCEFLKRELEGYLDKIDIYEKDVDLGIITKEGSLEIDKEKLEVALFKYLNSWEDLIKEEEAFIKNENVTLIVSDIVPWIIKVGNKLRIKTVLISNFTWVEIYKEHLNKKLWQPFLECYKNVDYAILYKLYNNEMKKYLTNYKEVSFNCREFNEGEVEKIKKSYKKPIIFVSVGCSVNINGEIDVEKAPYDFIVTSGIKLKGKNVYHLKDDVKNTNDYIKASKLVITKAGWGTVSEAMCANKPCLIFSRRDNAEDRTTIDKLVKMRLAKEVLVEDMDIISDINEVLKLEENFKDKGFKNDHINIVEIIEKMI